MVAQPHRSWMSVQEYLDLERNSLETRYEYVDGYAYMLSGGSVEHSIIIGNMFSELKSALRGGPCRVHTSDMRVQLSTSRYVYPDVSVSCDARDYQGVITLEHACLAVEVLSASTEAYDRGEKFRYYRTCPSIQEYVLITTQCPFVEVYRRVQDFWALHAFGLGEQVMLSSIHVQIPVAALYENVLLPVEDENS